jgi:hypothetical protein
MVRTLEEIISLTLKARDLAKTFRSKVGFAYEMYDGTIFTGFNIETYAHKGYHAEETGLLLAMSPTVQPDGTVTGGYNGTDFRRGIEIYQDASHDEVEVFPGCLLHCWGTWNEFTHPYFEIVVADITGKVHYQQRIREMTSLKPPAKIYPSNKIRITKPKSNITPRLPLNPELQPFYDSDPEFRELCDEILHVRHE